MVGRVFGHRCQLNGHRGQTKPSRVRLSLRPDYATAYSPTAAWEGGVGGGVRGHMTACCGLNAGSQLRRLGVGRCSKLSVGVANTKRWFFGAGGGGFGSPRRDGEMHGSPLDSSAVHCAVSWRSTPGSAIVCSETMSYTLLGPASESSSLQFHNTMLSLTTALALVLGAPFAPTCQTVNNVVIGGTSPTSPVPSPLLPHHPMTQPTGRSTQNKYTQL